MNVLLADKKINTGYSQNDDEQNNCRGRCKGRISSAVAVEHIVDVAYYSIHLGGVKIRAEEGHRVAIRLERSDKACDNKVEYSGRDGGKSDMRKHSSLAGAVNARRIVICLRNGGNSACKDKYLKGHNDPDRIEAKNKHLCPIGTVDKVDGRDAEHTKKCVYKSVVIHRGLKEYHKHEADRQSIGHVGQEEYGLEGFTKLIDRAKRKRDKKRKSRGQRNGDKYEYQGVLHSLQEIGIAQNVAVIIKSYTEEGLGRRVIALLKGVDKHVY